MKDVPLPCPGEERGWGREVLPLSGLSFQSLLNAPTSWEALENAEGFAGTQQAGVRAKQSLTRRTVPFTENGLPKIPPAPPWETEVLLGGNRRQGAGRPLPPSSTRTIDHL